MSNVITLHQPTLLFFTSKSDKIVGWLVVLLFYVHGKHLRSCRDGQLT